MTASSPSGAETGAWPLTPQQLQAVANGRPYAPTPPLSRVHLASSADPTCVGFNARRTTVKLGDPGSSRLLPPLVTYEWSAIGRLTNLTPPAALAYDWQQTLNDLRTIAEETAAVAYARGRGAGIATAATRRIEEADRKLRALATHDGVSSCV
jgi:hypothetical protein